MRDRTHIWIGLIAGLWLLYVLLSWPEFLARLDPLRPLPVALAVPPAPDPEAVLPRALCEWRIVIRHEPGMVAAVASMSQDLLDGGRLHVFSFRELKHAKWFWGCFPQSFSLATRTPDIVEAFEEAERKQKERP